MTKEAWVAVDRVAIPQEVDKMIEGLLVVISMLLVVLSVVTYQMIIEVRKIPNRIYEIFAITFDSKIDEINKSIKKIKDDLDMD
jgi:CHASE3 domain sensor protein